MGEKRAAKENLSKESPSQLFGMLAEAREEVDADATPMVGWGSKKCSTKVNIDNNHNIGVSSASQGATVVIGEFTQCGEFQGAKTGYEFKTGDKGTGYYRIAGGERKSENKGEKGIGTDGTGGDDKENGVLHLNRSTSEPTPIDVSVASKPDGFTDMEELD